MMHYYHETHKLIALHYANKLGDSEAKNIIENGKVTSPHEAAVLSKFYWAMVKATIEDRDKNGGEPFADIDSALEGLHNTFSIHLSNEGYDDVWDSVVDEQE